MTLIAHKPQHMPDHARPTGRLVRFLAIAIVFAMGAAFAIPAPAAAQVTASVSGFVVDGDGNPLADAEVVLKKRVNGSLWSYHETQTDGSGAFSFSGLSPGDGWTLTGRLDGHRTNSTVLSFAAGQNAATNLTLVSLSERTYSGRVLDAAEQTPLAGAIITVRSWGEGGENVRTATSGADGTFRVQLFSTENQITIAKGGYATYHDWVYQPSGLVERVIHLNAVPPQTATITGTVVDETGAPVQAYVNIYPVYQECCVYGETRSAMIAPDHGYYYNNHNSTVTDEDGTFTMKAYPGQITIQANRQGYLVASQQLTLDEDGTSTVTLTLGKLPERSVTISGIVTNEKTGKPIPGASVNVQVPAAGDSAYTSTDESGRFSVTVRPGYTLIEVNHWGYCCIAYAEDVASDSEGASNNESKAISPPMPHPRDGTKYHPVSRVLVTEADQDRTFNVALPPKPEPTSTVVGYVLDAETGEAVPGAHVSLQNHATGEWGEAVTDQNGSYKFVAYGGYHTVRVWLEGYLPFARNVALPADGSTRVDLEVTPGQHVSEGWWSPDGYGGGHGDDGVRPMPLSAPSKTASAEDSATAGSSGPQMAMDSDSRSAGLSGEQGYSGSGGGLPAYDPAKKDDTFGIGESAESPGLSPLILVVMALGALALVAGMRRRI